MVLVAEFENRSISGQNTSATPATPTMAAMMVAGRNGCEKKSRMPSAFMNTTIENSTATSPEVRYCSEQIHPGVVDAKQQYPLQRNPQVIAHAEAQRPAPERAIGSSISDASANRQATDTNGDTTPS